MNAMLKAALRRLAVALPYGRAFVETRSTQTPISLASIVRQKVLGQNRRVYWPVHPSTVVQRPERIWIGVETSPGLMPGCYLQGTGGIVVGDYTQVAPNVGIISSNHDLYDTRLSRPEPIVIGRHCWLGMGAIILPGVTLGPHTVVAAGAVVTRSFEAGFQVLAGVPARSVKPLDRARCVSYASECEYHGFVRADRFREFARTHLDADVVALAAGVQ